MRSGLRLLSRQPGFAAASIVILALGLGGTTALFTVVNGVVLRPLPFEDPDKLVMIWESNLSQGQPKNEASMANFLDWRAQSEAFSSIGGYGYSSANLTGEGEGIPERVSSATVTADLFPTLGIAPSIGRSFTPEEETDGSRVVILSHRLWQRRYGGNSSVLVHPITINGTAHQVVGVMPPKFRFPNAEVELWFPFDMTPERAGDRQFRYLDVLGRLKSGISLETAQQQMSGLARRLEEAYPDANSGWGIELGSMHEEVVGDVRPALLILLGTAAFVLLIACANVANLLLLRSTQREKEMAVRLALGASRLRLAGELFAENLILCLLSAVLALVLAFSGLRFLAAFHLEDVPRLDQIGIDFRVLGFTLLVTLATTLVLGAIPAFRTPRLNVQDNLKEGNRGSSQGVRNNRLRSLLVVVETALTVLLLIGAGLMLKSLLRLQQIDPGFNPDRVLTMEISLPRASYPNGQAIVDFFDQLLVRLQASPEIEHAGVVTNLPLSGNNMTTGFQLAGRDVSSLDSVPEVSFQSISPDYFRAMEIPLVKGRFFSSADAKDSPKVVIVNRAVAERFWPDGDVVGQRVTIVDSTNYDCEVVGVVGNVKHWGLDADVNPEIYFPLTQSTYRWVSLVASSRRDPLQAISSVRREIAAIDPNQPVFNVQTARQVYADSIERSRF
ncbi:MAG: ABC transporter permease, partial [Acidobacteria bacterium]|nr:ABC transporter permease [Acidobacteriota bacterium]